MNNSLYFKILVIGFVLFTVSCADKPKQVAKNTKAKTEQTGFNNKLISTLNKGFFKAKFSPDNNKIVVTSNDDTGLKLYKINEDVMEHLNSKKGAGINPMFTPNGKYVVFQSHDFVNRRRATSIYLQDVSEKVIVPIIENKRDIKLLDVTLTNVIYLDGNDVKAFNITTGETTLNPKNITTAYTDNNLNLVAYTNGNKNILNPFSEGNYIWVSLSPDKTKILYNKSGKGTFISDLNGKTITELGRLHAAKWDDSGEWVIGMDDYDNGQEITKSDILLFSKDGKTKKNLTENSDKIALYPDMSSKGKKVIYHNENGGVYIMKMK
jgi:Tol biopolymer transport system component